MSINNLKMIKQKIILFLVVCFFLGACTGIKSNNGYMPVKENIDQLIGDAEEFYKGLLRQALCTKPGYFSVALKTSRAGCHRCLWISHRCMLDFRVGRQLVVFHFYTLPISFLDFVLFLCTADC